MKAHILRLAWDCREKHLHRFLKFFPNVCRDFGFPVAHDHDLSGALSQSRLWEIWNKEFTDVQREFVLTVGLRVVRSCSSLILHKQLCNNGSMCYIRL